MIKKCLPVVLLLLICRLPALADFSFDANCIDAYHAIMSMKMREARVILQKEKQQSPKNGIIVMLENYIDYFSLLASEDKNEYERLKDNRSTRISELEDNNSNSPYYRYTQAQVYLQWSFLKAKFGDYVSSGLDARKANGLVKDNIEKYPDFLPNKMDLALVNVLFGSIPASLKSLTRFFGMSGNTLTGLRQLEDVRVALQKTNYSFMNNEVIFFICTVDINVLHKLGDYQKLIGYLQGMDEGSLLKAYLQGVVASKTGHNDDAITYIEAAPKSGDYINVPAMHYMLGCAKLCKLENPSALLEYIREFRGTNYIKDSYLKIAYYYFLQNDEGKYQYYLKMVKTRGSDADEKDQLALSEANDARPNINLLKARLYFDGGYYAKALAALQAAETELRSVRDKIDYFYRMGRVYDRTDRLNDAITYYQKAIDLGRKTHYYYAANAALSTGKIYEDRKDYKRAADYYNEALSMKGHQFQTDIDNDAKAGLKRIGQ